MYDFDSCTICFYLSLFIRLDVMRIAKIDISDPHFVKEEET